MLLLPLLDYLLLAHRFLRPLCLLHGPPLLISGRWALQSPAFWNNLISCCVHATCNASPYFSYVTCEFSSHYARYLLG